MLPQDIDRLEKAHLQSRMLFGETRRNYVAKRAGLLNELTKAGRFPKENAERLVESAEAMWLPGFDTFSARGPSMQTSPNAEYLEAIRKEVGPEQFNLFVSSLRDFRVREHQDQQLTDQLARFVPPERFAKLEAQTTDLEGYRNDLANMVRQINPAMSLAGVERGFMAEQDPSIDPLSQTIALSLDPSQFDQKKAVHKELFRSVAEGLTEKQRKVLDQAFGLATRISRDAGKTWEEVPEGGQVTPDSEDPSVGTLTDEDGVVIQAGIRIRTESFDRDKTITRAADAFSALVADKRKPAPLAEQALKPFRTFFERSANLLHGRGFQSVEDVLKRAQDGTVGARAARIAAKPGIRMPLPKDNPGGADGVRTAIAKMTSQELALAIGHQKEVLADKRRAQYSLVNRIFRYRDVSGTAETTHSQTKGNKHKRRDRAEVKQLTRALTALMAEHRKRASHNVAGEFKMPDPGARNVMSSPREEFANQMNRQQSAQMPAHEGHVAVSASQEQNGRFDVKWHDPDTGKGFPLAGDANEAGAFAMIQAFQSVTSGPKSPMAERLVGEINRAGALNNADINLLRSSDLIDKDLDAAIGRRDLKAFVYPLKTGDVIFQMSDGSWHAGKREEFIAVAKQTGDQHMRAAADELVKSTGKVLPFERTRDGNTPSPSPSSSSAARMDVPEPRPTAPAASLDKMAASVGMAKPYVLDTNDDGLKDAARRDLSDISVSNLSEIHKATEQALRSASTPAERDGLMRGKLMVADVLKSKTAGVNVSAQPATNPSVSVAYKVTTDKLLGDERKRLEGLSAKDLKGMYKKTQNALETLPKGGNATPRDLRERQHLTQGRTALQEVMRNKGIELHSSNEQPGQQRARKGGPKR